MLFRPVILPFVARSFLARTAYTNSCMAGELRRQPNCAMKKLRERWTPELQNERLQLANKAAELKTCSKPIHAFPEIPRIIALLRPSGAKAGTTAGRRRKLRESFPPTPACSDVGEARLRVTLAGSRSGGIPRISARSPIGMPDSSPPRSGPAHPTSETPLATFRRGGTSAT